MGRNRARNVILGSCDGAWYTKQHGTTSVTVSQILVEWSQFFVHHSNNWQNLSIEVEFECESEWELTCVQQQEHSTIELSTMAAMKSGHIAIDNAMIPRFVMDATWWDNIKTRTIFKNTASFCHWCKHWVCVSLWSHYLTWHSNWKVGSIWGYT